MFLAFCCVFTICLAFQVIDIVGTDSGLGKLVFANVMWRHGDRPPVATFASDPYNNESLWPVPFGQLSNIGKRQHFELGQWLRKRYDSLLTKKYNKRNIYVMSSDIDRCLMSAESNMAGMFPPDGDQQWNPDLKWQPVPIHTIPHQMDNMLAAHKPCPAYDEEYKTVITSDKIKKINNSFKDVYEIQNKHCGELVETLEHVDWWYNALMIEKEYNFTLPAWATPDALKRMGEAAMYTFVLPAYTTKLARLKSGLLLKDMIENMKLKINKDPDGKNVNAYSAHDTTISYLMTALGMFNWVRPPYAACLMMELYAGADGGYKVAMFYRNDTKIGPYPLVHPNCTHACPFDKFVEIVTPILVDDWDEECEQVSSGGLRTIFIILGLVCFLILLLICTGVCIFAWLMKKERDRVNANRRNETPVNDDDANDGTEAQDTAKNSRHLQLQKKLGRKIKIRTI